MFNYVYLAEIFVWHEKYCKSLYSSVGIAMGYGLDGRGSISGRGKNLSLLHSVETSSGSHAAFHPTGTGGSFPESKAAGPLSRSRFERDTYIIEVTIVTT
jgi:hypothetical protein